MKEIHATNDNLIRRAQGLPIERITTNHLKSTFATWDDILAAEVITITIDGTTRVLKDKFGMWQHEQALEAQAA